MGNAISLRSVEDYDRALIEVESYFESPPELGTEAKDRFEVLVALIVEFEKIHFPMLA